MKPSKAKRRHQMAPTLTRSASSKDAAHSPVQVPRARGAVTPPIDAPYSTIEDLGLGAAFERSASTENGRGEEGGKKGEGKGDEKGLKGDEKEGKMFKRDKKREAKGDKKKDRKGKVRKGAEKMADEKVTWEDTDERDSENDRAEESAETSRGDMADILGEEGEDKRTAHDERVVAVMASTQAAQDLSGQNTESHTLLKHSISLLPFQKRLFSMVL